MPVNRDELHVYCTQRRGGAVVRLEGIVNEHAELRRHVEGLQGAVVFDLDKVSKITSFGVREWMSALRALRADYYAFVRCPPAIMTQFNVVAGFGGQGELVSFYAPYICVHCDVEFASLIDLRRSHALVSNFELPKVACPECGAEATFDDLPEQFLSYAASRARPQIPQEVYELMDSSPSGNGEAQAFRIKKEVSNMVTALWMSGALGADANVKRPLDGLEGFIIADLAGVVQANQDGVACLIAALATTDIRELAFARVRVQVAPLFATLGHRLPFPHRISSVLVSERCTPCGRNVDFELPCGVRDSTNANCPACGKERALELAPAIRTIVRDSGLPPPEIASFLDRRQPPPKLKTPMPRSSSLTGAMAWIPDSIVGQSISLRAILDAIRRVAPSDATVLIRGETGTGKEMLARSVHQLSQRRERPFVAVNIAALPPGTIESELFGHEKGAFTGATGRSIGRFERANGGTLFIDEIGDMPASAQAKLLRALQEHCIERVGGAETVPVDIRLVAATHRPLEEMMEEGSFREDLFYRLNVVPIFVPPLRERREDIWPLALHYLQVIQQRWGKSGITFAEGMRATLEHHTWPGNVRELVNVVERVVALAPSGQPAELPELDARSEKSLPAAQERGQSGKLKEAIDELERRMIVEALAAVDGNRTRAAKELGISRQALGQKIAKYNLP